MDRPYGSRDTELRCRGDANPPPQYRWVRQSAAGAVTLGHEAALRLGELRYEDQGEYYCEVTNQIASSRCVLQLFILSATILIPTPRSEAVVLTVHGPPRVNNDNKHLFLIEGADATIEVEFCGAPLPKQTWQIESVESRVSLVSVMRDHYFRFIQSHDVCGRRLPAPATTCSPWTRSGPPPPATATSPPCTSSASTSTTRATTCSAWRTSTARRCAPTMPMFQM